MTNYTFATRCPYCGRLNEFAATHANKPEGPADGDAAICFECGSVAVFDASANGNTRKPTHEERARFKNDPRVAIVIAAWRRVTRA